MNKRKFKFTCVVIYNNKFKMTHISCQRWWNLSSRVQSDNKTVVITMETPKSQYPKKTKQIQWDVKSILIIFCKCIVALHHVFMSKAKLLIRHTMQMLYGKHGKTSWEMDIGWVIMTICSLIPPCMSNG